MKNIKIFHSGKSGKREANNAEKMKYTGKIQPNGRNTLKKKKVKNRRTFHI